jgi:LysR family transcriptional regulator, low CO2-responsive transcriptional regulator
LSKSIYSIRYDKGSLEWSFPLFERIGKRLALTDAGQELLVCAAIVLRALDDAEQNLMTMRGSSGGNVKVGLVSTARHIVPHMLTRFRISHPTIVVGLTEGNRREIIDA